MLSFKSQTFKNSLRKIVFRIPFLWLLFFILVPFFLIVKISLSEATWGTPPYKPLLQFLGDNIVQFNIHLENYQVLLDILYRYSIGQSLKLASLSTLSCLLLAYPMAYTIARQEEHIQTRLLLLVLLPFWTSFLLRVYAWVGILSPTGFLNDLLSWAGLLSQPLEFLYTPGAALVGMVYCYLPFMILPLYASLNKFDFSLLEAAADLGCKPLRAFWDITLPLTRPGILGGCLLVFIPSMGEFVIPELLGGGKTVVLGKVIWIEFFSNRDWPVASALAVLMVLFLVIPVVLLQRKSDHR